MSGSVGNDPIGNVFLPTSPLGSPSVSTNNYESNNISTISKSNQESDAISASAGMPCLMPPMQDFVLLKFISGAIQAYHEIIVKGLNNWIEDLHKQKEETEKQLKSPAFQAWLAAKDPAFQAKSSDAVMNAWFKSDDFQNALKAMTPDGVAASLIAKSMYEAAGRIENVLGTIKANVNAADGFSDLAIKGLIAGAISSISSGASTEFQQLMQSLGGQFRNSLTEMLGGLMAKGVSILSDLQKVEEAKKTNKKPTHMDFALNNAKDVITIVNSPVLTREMALVFGKMKDGANLTGAQKAEYEELIKFILLATAVTKIYRAEIGGWKVGAQEFRDLIAGRMNLPEGDIRHDLLRELNQTGLSNADRAESLSRLAKHLETDPPQEETLGQVLQRMWDQGVNEQVLINSPIK